MTKKKTDDDQLQDPQVQAASQNEHVTYHLDRDPNDPRNAAPTPQLPSLDDKETQGPAHGRISNDGDQSAEGQNGPNV